MSMVTVYTDRDTSDVAGAIFAWRGRDRVNNCPAIVFEIQDPRTKNYTFVAVAETDMTKAREWLQQQVDAYTLVGAIDKFSILEVDS